MSSLPSGCTSIINTPYILSHNSGFGYALFITLWKMIKKDWSQENGCYCHKGKVMSTLLFFSLQAAVCGFSEHFNLLYSWTCGTWPCPLVTPSRFAKVNIRWGPCCHTDAIQSAFRTIPSTIRIFQLVATALKWFEGPFWHTNITKYNSR